MGALVVSPLYVALGGLLLLVLTASVVARRRAARIGLGDGGDVILLRRMRAHANAVETLLPALLMLVVLELAGGPHWLLHAAGSVLLLGRVLHAWGLSGSGGVSFGRFHGMLLTLVVLLVLPLALLWRVVAG